MAHISARRHAIVPNSVAVTHAHSYARVHNSHLGTLPFLFPSNLFCRDGSTALTFLSDGVGGGGG